MSLLEYRAAIDSQRVCCLRGETRATAATIDAVCAVPGIDRILPAQVDLSTDLGITGQFGHPHVLAVTTKVGAAANAAGIPLGSIAPLDGAVPR